MSFGLMAWLGLLGLIGIPILILIYILKPKFQEKKVSSTYIWKLSLKYRKRKIPLQWLKSLLLVVQCIIVAVLALLLAKPYIGKAMNSYDYKKVVVIDASASMMTVEDGKTRFDRAIDRACEIAETATEENTMTVIMCGAEPITIAENNSNPGDIQRLLRSQEPSGTTADYASAITAAMDSVPENTEAGFTLITDRDYADPGFFEVINVSQGAWNLAVDDAWQDIDSVKYFDRNENGIEDKGEQNNDYLQPIFMANYFSYNKQLKIVPCAEITFATTTELTNTGSGQTTVKERAPVVMKYPAIELGQMEENVYGATVTFSYKMIRDAVGVRFDENSYKSVKFYAEDENGNVITDSFADDDVYYVMADGNNEKFKVLLVGSSESADKSNMFLESVLQSVSSCYVEKIISGPTTDTALAGKNKGYDLYVYDGYLPKDLPIDGAVLFVNPPKGDYNTFNFSIGNKVSTPISAARIFERNASNPVMEFVKETEVATKKTGVFAYTQYAEAKINNTSKVKQLVSTEDGKSPLIFVGETDARIKFTVFSFDVVYTDFPLVFQNYLIMMQNIVSYSTEHTILNEAGKVAYGDYLIGDKITINVKPNTTKLEISVGEGASAFTKTIDGTDLNGAVTYKFDRGGKYTITQTLRMLDGTSSTIKHEVFVLCDSEESNFASQGGTLTGESFEKTAKGSGMSKELIYKYFAGALIILLLIEWGLQYREQY